MKEYISRHKLNLTTIILCGAIFILIVIKSHEKGLLIANALILANVIVTIYNMIDQERAKKRGFKHPSDWGI